jgi:hypothetical protein
MSQFSQSWLHRLVRCLSVQITISASGNDTPDGERGRTRHGDFLIANDLFFATSFFKVA